MLLKLTLEVIAFLHKKGFTVVLNTADNNRINQRLFKNLTSADDAVYQQSFPQPSRNKRRRNLSPFRLRSHLQIDSKQLAYRNLLHQFYCS